MASALSLARSVIHSIDPLIKGSLLISHGLFGSKQNWKSLSRALNRLRCGTVCTVDLRNHGGSPHSFDMSFISMANDLIRVVDELKLTDVCLVGHSLGGKASMCAALLAPEKFSRLVVVDISPAHTSRAQGIMPHLRLMSEADLYRAERESDGTLSGVRQWLSDEWKEAVPNERLRNFLLTNLDEKRGEFFWRVNLEAIESSWHDIVGFPHKELKGHTFNGPTLFVAGGRSDYISQTDLPSIRSYFPLSELVTVKDAGHWVHVDDPQTFLQLMAVFIKGPAEGIADLDGVEYFK